MPIFPNLDSSVFKISMPTVKPYAGALLVAEPFLKEDWFNHAVIMLVDYEEGEKAMGLVLNHPTAYTLGEAIRGIDADVDTPVYSGGPVSTDRLFYLHTVPSEFPDCSEIAPGVYVGGDFDIVKDYLNAGGETEGLMRFFIGCSGWDAGQLEEEIKNHVWAVAPCPPASELFAETGDAMWHTAVRSLGPRFRHWLYHPLHPQLN